MKVDHCYRFMKISTRSEQNRGRHAGSLAIRQAAFRGGAVIGRAERLLSALVNERLQSLHFRSLRKYAVPLNADYTRSVGDIARRAIH